MSRRGLTLTSPGYTPSGRLTQAERYARLEAWKRRHARHEIEREARLRRARRQSERS